MDVSSGTTGHLHSNSEKLPFKVKAAHSSLFYFLNGKERCFKEQALTKQAGHIALK